MVLLGSFSFYKLRLLNWSESVQINFLNIFKHLLQIVTHAWWRKWWRSFQELSSAFWLWCEEDCALAIGRLLVIDLILSILPDANGLYETIRSWCETFYRCQSLREIYGAEKFLKHLHYGICGFITVQMASWTSSSYRRNYHYYQIAGITKITKTWFLVIWTNKAKNRCTWCTLFVIVVKAAKAVKAVKAVQVVKVVKVRG